MTDVSILRPRRKPRRRRTRGRKPRDQDEREQSVGGDALDALLYTLVRDHVLPGVMEKIVQDVEQCGAEKFCFSNTHLARYAKELRCRLEGINR